MNNKGLKHDFNLTHLILIPIGVALAVVLYQLSVQLKTPFYLDVVAIMLVAMLAGPWVGSVTAFLSAAVNSIFIPTAIAFAPVSIAIALIVGFISYRGLFKNFVGYVLAWFFVTVGAAIVVTPIVAYMFGGVTGAGTDLITAVFVQSGKDIFSASFLQSIVTGLYNNAISLVIVSIIIISLSKRILSMFNYGEQFMYKFKKSKATQESSDDELGGF